MSPTTGCRSIPYGPRTDLPPVQLQRGGAPSGRILLARPPTAALQIFGEEVPREGARVLRAFQYARWIDGRTFLWMGRQKNVGRGEGASGLRFDTIQQPERST